MDQKSNIPLATATVKQLRQCGHYLYYKMGGKAGRQRILKELTEHPELLQRELQDILGVQSGSLSEVIIKMEAEGLVEKIRSEKDGRNFVLKLTEKGKGQAKYFMEEYEGRVEQMMSCFSEEQLENLHELLRVMLGHWNEIEERKDSQI